MLFRSFNTNVFFITGKEQKIYFPRAEHAIVKYGSETIHYATAVPKGEGRYILDKNSGDVKLIRGPKMLLPDPRSEVIVKRVLNDKAVQLWFPGNEEARRYNLGLQDELGNLEEDFLEDNSARSFAGRTKQTLYAAAAVGMMADEMSRKEKYTKPRTIKLDTKYEGAVLLNIWPNYAVQVVNKQGTRKVVEGPAVVMLEYDETLDMLELSTSKPKTDHKLMQTTYLQTKNNVVSDIITVETKDLINVDVRLSYKVNFEGEPEKWFGVADYVKLLCQHMRSLVRNAVKKIEIEEFNNKATDIIRDTILGKGGEDKKRVGRSFEENGMNIYDVEVLNVTIGDHSIADMLVENQHETVEQNLRLAKLQKNLEYTKKQEEFKRKELDERVTTSTKSAEVALKEIENGNSVDVAKDKYRAELESTRLSVEQEKQETLDAISAATLARDKAIEDYKTTLEEQRTAIKTKSLESAMKAIQPKLIEALIVNGNSKLADTLAKNLKSQRSGLNDLFSGGGFKEILETVKGSPLESMISDLADQYKNLHNDKD